MKNSKKISATALATGFILGGGLTASAASMVTIEAGDTFWDIAKEYGIGVDELIEDNAQFEPTALPIGAKIKVHVKDAIHFVEPGDTLYGIAAIHDVTVDTLFDYNPGIDSLALMPGDGVVVGSGKDGSVNAMEDAHAMQGKQMHDMPMMNADAAERMAELLAGLTAAANPAFPVGSKVMVEADHMPGMQGVEATISGAYDTTVYAVTYTDADGVLVEHHKWIVHEGIENPGEAPLEPRTEVTLAAEHMPGMAGAEAVIDSAEETTVYTIDYVTDSGETVMNHMWVTGEELIAIK